MYTFTINSAEDLLNIIHVHYHNKKPFSLVRIGDGENFILAQNTVHTVQELIGMYNVVAGNKYSGIAIPNIEARDRLLDAVRRATVVGFLNQRDNYCWYPMTEKIFNHYGLNPPGTCYAFINYHLVRIPKFYHIFRDAKILLVGKPMAGLAKILINRYGFTNITACLNLRHYWDLDIVLQQMSGIDYQVALIAAGANAVIVALAAMDAGKIGLDLGHAVDNIIIHDGKGEYAWGGTTLPTAPGRQTRLGIRKPY
ncbi:hypothetical protein DCCM_2561 [Desulfocucumis palustris]|uniref:GT-D fold-like domain-containing protein n=1 Tax=Desulfocucumis palustris TaxID=1898651 RepID=A0A2L2XBH3_9FIRM|nr:GT-D fold domain-containing glycosyltransferase [Desulfocucumis palustris]GBF33460.1 hypothetical protein DCCM_2561 [Desulfocucumis palustris]